VSLPGGVRKAKPATAPEVKVTKPPKAEKPGPLQLTMFETLLGAAQ
jgi:hypothetical protein